MSSVQARSGARRREATQAAIVDGMRRLLKAGEAYASLSIEQIVKEAGVSRATFYLHFAEKKDVMLRLAYEIVEQRFSIGAEQLAEPQIGPTAVTAMITEMVDRWMDDAHLLDAVIALTEQDPEMRTTWVNAVHEVGAMFANLMRSHWDVATPSEADTETLGRVLAWMFERSAHQLTRDPYERDAVIRALTEVIWRVFEYRPAIR